MLTLKENSSKTLPTVGFDLMITGLRPDACLLEPLLWFFSVHCFLFLLLHNAGSSSMKTQCADSYWYFFPINKIPLKISESFSIYFVNNHLSVVDPGIPEGEGADSQSGCANLLFCKCFVKNCMKRKELGPKGSLAPQWICQCLCVIFTKMRYVTILITIYCLFVA